MLPVCTIILRLDDMKKTRNGLPVNWMLNTDIIKNNVMDWILTWILIILFVVVAIGRLGGTLLAVLDDILKNLGFKE